MVAFLEYAGPRAPGTLVLGSDQGGLGKKLTMGVNLRDLS